MSVKQSDSDHLRRYERLKKPIKAIVKYENLGPWHKTVEKLSNELNISFLDCAAALAYLNQQHFTSGVERNKTPTDNPALAQTGGSKMVRYRLEVGQKHHVTIDDLKKVIVEESGVDKALIGAVEMHAHYTIVDLPAGMPADIYHHMKAVIIKNHPLRLKRLSLDNPKDKKPFRRKKRNRRNNRQEIKGQRTCYSDSI